MCPAVCDDNDHDDVNIKCNRHYNVAKDSSRQTHGMVKLMMRTEGEKHN